MTNLEKLVKYYEEFRDAHDLDLEEGDEYVVIQNGEWQQDGKYQNAEHIVQLNGEYFSILESRSGSYHSDWHYGTAYIAPVERKEETKVVVSWVPTAKPVTVEEEW